MMRIEAGGTGRYCDGMSRRSFVQLGVAGMAATSLPQILSAKAANAKASKNSKDTSVILIWLDGGPGHMDMYDMKPDAPAEYRGIWSPIRTNVRELQVTELFPKQAKVADKFSVVRSLYHGSGDHFAGAHLMLTSRSGASGADQVGKYPGVGAYATRIAGPRKPGMPAYVSVPYASTVGRRPGYMGGRYLGRDADPFETSGDPNRANFKVRNLSFAGGMSVNRLEDRKHLLRSFDKIRRDVDNSGAMDSMDAFEKKAYEMVVGPTARKAFDISQEDAQTRDLYGRNSWGQSTLLARRLVDIRNRTYGRLGSSLELTVRDGKPSAARRCRRVRIVYGSVATRSARSRAGGSMWGIQSHAEDE